MHCGQPEEDEKQVKKRSKAESGQTGHQVKRPDPKRERHGRGPRHFWRALQTSGPVRATQPKKERDGMKTKKAAGAKKPAVTVKDLKVRKNPKGGSLNFGLKLDNKT
jgi:hypothetical protein